MHKKLKELPTDIEDQVFELQFYVNLSNDEYGEGCQALINAWYGRTVFRKDFVPVLEKEIYWHLKNYWENTEIVETIIKPEPYASNELWWNSDFG